MVPVGEKHASVVNAVGEAPASSTACPHVPQGAGWPEGLVHNSTEPSPIDAGRHGKAGAPSASAAVQRRRPVALALGLALEFDAIGVVDNAITFGHEFGGGSGGRQRKEGVARLELTAAGRRFFSPSCTSWHGMGDDTAAI